MKKGFRQILLLVLLSHASIFFIAMIRPHASNKKIIVAADGSGDFKTIQEAINSLPQNNKDMVTISIRNGVYNEKVLIEKPNISLEGQDPEKTIIQFNIARDEWRCDHPDDWGVATMNVRANDITLRNLTVSNNFGFDFQERTINCPNDTVSHQKQLRKDGHQMALRVMNATRLRAINCHFVAYGGDTVSPWDVDNGQWYFKGCTMEGGVDFYCPRGWAWAEDCIFISHTGPAAIWHDGSKNEDSKSILVNCTFRGYKDFYLGRYHRDAQFYLLNCHFSQNMKDTAIYLVPTSNTIQWGKRTYFYNCHREGAPDYSWYQDNLPAGLKPSDITVNWLFKDKWHPEKD